jgi:hypothetical protein
MNGYCRLIDQILYNAFKYLKNKKLNLFFKDIIAMIEGVFKVCFFLCF